MRGIWLTPRDVLPLAIAAAASSALLWAAPQSRGAAPGVVIERNVEARMRDGVVLRADVYRPDAPGRFPVLLQRTPYSKSSGRAAATTLATHGYVVVIQDSRGRYTSDGVARPHDEAEDGHDAVEWAASLPYSTGKVGMFGASYLATTTLQAASTAPPHLAAIQPSAAYSHRFAGSRSRATAAATVRSRYTRRSALVPPPSSSTATPPTMVRGAGPRGRTACGARRRSFNAGTPNTAGSGTAIR